MDFAQFYGPQVHKIAGFNYFLFLESHKALTRLQAELHSFLRL